MDLIILWIALFVPFILVSLPIGIGYMKKGYKDGPVRSLISLAATVLSIIVAILISKLTSWGISMALIKLLPADLFSSLGFLASFVELLARGIIQVVLSFVLFVLFFIICLIISKNLVKLIKVEKFEEKLAEKKGMNFLGLGIRFVDTLLVAFLVLIPLYGTLAFASPTVSKFYSMAVKEPTRAGEYIECVAEHPIVMANRVGPGAWVVNSLSSFGVEEANINLAEVAETCETLISKYKKIVESSSDEKIAACNEMNEFLRETIIEKPWCYDVLKVLGNEGKAYLEKLPDSYEKSRITEYTVFLDISREDFKDNSIALIDFVTYTMNSGVIEYFRGGGDGKLPEEFYEELGDLINYSDHAVMLKKMIYKEVVAGIMKENPEDAAAYVEKYLGDGKVEKDLRGNEAKAFLILVSEGGEYGVIESFARHPLAGAEAASELIDDEFLLKRINGYSQYDENVENGDEGENGEDPENNGMSEELQEKLSFFNEALIKSLKKFEDNPDDVSFRMYVNATTYIFDFLYGNGRNLELYCNEDILDYVINDIGKECFEGSENESAMEFYELIKAMQESGVYKEKEGDYVDFSAYIELVEAAETEGKWPEGENDINEEFGYTVRELINNVSLCEAFDAAIQARGKDPIGLGKNLSTEQKKYFAKVVDENCEFSYQIVNPDAFDISGEFPGEGGLVSEKGSSITISGKDFFADNAGQGGSQFIVGVNGENGESEDEVNEFIEKQKESLKASGEILKKFVGVE